MRGQRGGGAGARHAAHPARVAAGQPSGHGSTHHGRGAGVSTLEQVGHVSFFFCSKIENRQKYILGYFGESNQNDAEYQLNEIKKIFI